MPTANIVFGGSGANRTVTVTPAANQTGTATITVTVSDGTADRDRRLRADGHRRERCADDLRRSPTKRSTEDTRDRRARRSPSAMSRRRPDSLTLSGARRTPTLVPAANIVFGGSGANRTVTVTPAANQTGTATITVTVSDGR